MISTNDTTILAMLSRYPNMPPEEADSYIAKIEHEENIPICHAVIGRIDKSELDEDARETFTQFSVWSERRTRRTRDEQWTARRREKETRTSIRMNQLHDMGVISDEVMLLYGISGPLPEREMYSSMSQVEKEAMWRDRIESRFGPTRLQFFRCRRTYEVGKVNWQKEGF